MPGRNRRKVAARLLYLFAAIAVGLDQLSKVAITSLVLFGESVSFVGLRITPVQNTGVAFGLLRGYGSILAVAAVLIAALFFAFGRRSVRAPLTGAALGLMIGGSAGNLLDRLVRGYVFDFIDVGFWPVFNLADCAITVGVGLLILKLIFLERRREL
jgi:signal peptidase II